MIKFSKKYYNQRQKTSKTTKINLKWSNLSKIIKTNLPVGFVVRARVVFGTGFVVGAVVVSKKFHIRFFSILWWLPIGVVVSNGFLRCEHVSGWSMQQSPHSMHILSQKQVPTNPSGLYPLIICDCSLLMTRPSFVPSPQGPGASK